MDKKTDSQMRNPLKRNRPLSTDEAYAVITVLDEISGLNWPLIERIIDQKGIEPKQFVRGANLLCDAARVSPSFSMDDF